LCKVEDFNLLDFVLNLIFSISLRMNLPRYGYSVDKSFLEYEFFSDGPKGLIRKVVRFTLRASNDGSPFYNLAFGDWDEAEQRVDDFIVTDNEDTELVLATVATIVMDFSSNFDDITILAEGSTNSRTRLYQMGINKLKKEIEPVFDVYGLDKKSGWEPFQSGINYDALLVIKKKD
jgi:hypothetical protein